MRILGIETSCDETAAAIVDDGLSVRASVVRSQDRLHAPWAGIVPEIACRAHTEVAAAIVEEALRRAACTLDAVHAVAVTHRPGLVGSLVVGVALAKAIAWARGLPLVGVDHLAAHAYAARLEHPDLAYPYLALVVSGGHTEIRRCDGPGDHRVLGRTRDDAAGEAFDKVATILGLGYPGGPALEKKAAEGDPTRVRFTRPLLDAGGLDFSFSGLKTAVLYRVRRAVPGEEAPGTADLAASFQEAVVDVLVAKTLRAAQIEGIDRVVLGGGVGRNGRLRARLREASAGAGLDLRLPGPDFCTDNAAMIAGLGYHLLARDGASSAGLAAAAR